MAFKIQTENVDFTQGRATVALTDNDGKQRHVHINVPLETPGNQPEAALRQRAKQAAAQALRDALHALEGN
ncbi:hypothetical protein [Thalassovita sp.]|uniref:hypothetical protein n=1 Tax=Thalassovita sp. TaxID=1979401 RepID=UPI002B269C8D|nr:hypothetical protein [Thalassovita sp.]